MDSGDASNVVVAKLVHGDGCALLLGGPDRRPTSGPASGASSCQPDQSALTDEVPLELGKRAEQVRGER